MNQVVVLTPKEVDELIERSITAARAVAKLEAAQRWIPVAERLPGMVLPSDAVSDECLVWDGANLWLAYYHGPSGQWILSDPDRAPELPITHWYPLPAPPEPEVTL